MAFQEITNNSRQMSYWPKKASERKVGDSIVGVYKNSQDRTRPDGTHEKLHFLETEDGLVGVNSSAVIDSAMAQIPEGSTVKIIFNGKARSQKTGREYCDFKVYIDSDSKADDKEESKDDVDLSTLNF